MIVAGETPKWSARDEGTPENEWLGGIPWAGLGRLNADAVCERFERVVVVSPHPDDETLAVGALMVDLATRGMKVEVLALTDGECSHGRARVVTQEMIRAVRSDELDAALVALGDVTARKFHLPDGGLAANSVELQRIFADAFLSNAPTLVIAPHPQDGHIDHDTAGRLAADVAEKLGVAYVHYPVWLWHWCAPAALTWEHTVAFSPSAVGLNRKREALDCYSSQTGLFGLDEPVLPTQVLSHFDRPVELLFDPSGVLPRAADAGRTPPASFDGMFAESDDPWGFESRWYERRKRALVMAMLPNENLGRVLDLGCSTGVLTQLLAARATSVIGVDGSEEALKRARKRSSDIGSDDAGRDVEWRQGLVPEALASIEGTFDTIVISEIGYFLDGATLLELFSAVTGLLADDGIVVCVNWQHLTKNIPLDGTYVDRAARSAWQTIAHYADDDVAITIGTKVAR